MEHLENVNGYLLLALQECDKLYSDDESPDQALAELEHVINEALDKLEQLKD